MNGSSPYPGFDRRANSALVYSGIDRRAGNVRPAINDERALVKKATTRNRDAFARLYDRHVERIYRYIYYKVGTHTEAEDLTAQVFLKAWEAIGGYQMTGRPFSAWLYRIAHNLTVDYFRTRHELTLLDEIPPIKENRDSLEEITDQHLTSDTLHRAIERLTVDQQHVIILRFLEGYSTDQVAYIMGKQPGAVRTLQHRALARLNGIFRKGAEG